jgi:hypothetical protein
MKTTVLFFISVVAFLQSSFCSNGTDSIKTPVKHPKIVSYKFRPDFSSFDSVGIDTSLYRYQISYKTVSDRSFDTFLGNLYSPYESNVYSNRTPFNDFIFSHYMDYNFHKPEEILYYKAWSPYTIVNYVTGGPRSRQEQKFNFLHTQNVNKNLNLGILGDLGFADGQFLDQRISSNAFTFFTSYRGAQYSIFANATLNSYKAKENGGINSGAAYIDSLDAENTIGVNLTNASTSIKNKSIFIYQRLYLTGSYKEDTLRETSKWNEVVSLVDKFKFDYNARSYSDVPSTFYTRTYSNKSKTFDSLYFRRFENLIQVALNANPILKVPAELRFGIKNEFDKYSLVEDTLRLKSETYVNNALVGSLSNRFSKTFSWGATGEYYFAGDKFGTTLLTGDAEKTIWDNVTLQVSGRFALTQPSYFLRDYQSNNLKWTNSNFKLQKTTSIHGGLEFKKFKFSVEGQIDSYTDLVYFGADTVPVQNRSIFAVNSLTVNKRIDWGVFHTDIRLTLQSSGDASVAIPNFSGFNSTFLQFELVKNVFWVQIGGEVFYNSLFYSDAYMPSTGMFYTQRKIQTGNYPYTDLFYNMRLKRTRFFIKYERFNSVFPGTRGYYLPSYPFNPGMLKFGISWTFYD